MARAAAAMCASFTDIFIYIFYISYPNNFELGTALTRAHSKTPEINRMNGSRDMRITDRQTGVPVIYR